VTIVLDSSVTMAWFLNEPGPPLHDLIDQIVDEGAAVPDFWTLEVANVFQAAIRRKRTTSTDRDAAFAELRLLPIAIEKTDRDVIWLGVVGLSGKHGLTVYDATYLELALRTGLPLATLDKDLIRAARAEGVAVLP
jgi:predicted nucleic acid-binding protein